VARPAASGRHGAGMFEVFTSIMIIKMINIIIIMIRIKLCRADDSAPAVLKLLHRYQQQHQQS
jgi:hypothetical protein